ncbi:hypothetical protein X797_007838 [Metarhizium robertsii]|uniref:Uncharacterized protein n=1 Tax=Metarhizium robertsii TaxID=568076 RepID=A0A0A1UT04_9HYPO|nr:hypothetical protein X797_007838 [Metarhizium robertsii]
MLITWLAIRGTQLPQSRLINIAQTIRLRYGTCFGTNRCRVLDVVAGLNTDDADELRMMSGEQEYCVALITGIAKRVPPCPKRLQLNSWTIISDGVTAERSFDGREVLKGGFHSQDKDFKGMLDAPSCPWYFNIGLSNQHLWQHIQAYIANTCK